MTDYYKDDWPNGDNHKPDDPPAMVVKSILLHRYHSVFEAPKGARVLSVNRHLDWVDLWFLCDPLQPLEKRRIAVVPTDSPVPPRHRYIGSAPFGSSYTMCHVFEPRRD